jgi:hypothetical protein
MGAKHISGWRHARSYLYICEWRTIISGPTSLLHIKLKRKRDHSKIPFQEEIPNCMSTSNSQYIQRRRIFISNSCQNTNWRHCLLASHSHRNGGQNLWASSGGTTDLRKYEWKVSHKHHSLQLIWRIEEYSGKVIFSMSCECAWLRTLSICCHQ